MKPRFFNQPGRIGKWEGPSATSNYSTQRCSNSALLFAGKQTVLLPHLERAGCVAPAAAPETQAKLEVFIHER
jgi:hypothetical protein